MWEKLKWNKNRELDESMVVFISLLLKWPHRGASLSCGVGRGPKSCSKHTQTPHTQFNKHLGKAFRFLTTQQQQQPPQLEADERHLTKQI